MIKRMKMLLRKDIHLSIVVSMLLLVIILMAMLLGKSFYSQSNLQSMAFQIPELGIISVGMMLAILLGGIDLSMIANANMTGIIAGYVLVGRVFDISKFTEAGLIWIAVIIVVALSTLGGYLNGVLITKFGIIPMVATLGTMTLYSGIGMALSGGKGVVGFPDKFLKFGSGTLLGIPYIFLILLLVMGITSIILSKTVIGKKIHYIGESETAARFSSINTEKITRIVYTAVGTLAGIASLIMMMRVNSAKVGYGDTYTLNAILICVLGGVDINGGKGSVIGVLLAIITLQFLQSAFTLWQFSPFAKKIIWGTLLLAVMFADLFINKARLSVQRGAKKKEVLAKL